MTVTESATLCNSIMWKLGYHGEQSSTGWNVRQFLTVLQKISSTNFHGNWLHTECQLYCPLAVSDDQKAASKAWRVSKETEGVIVVAGVVGVVGEVDLKPGSAVRCDRHVGDTGVEWLHEAEGVACSHTGRVIVVIVREGSEETASAGATPSDVTVTEQTSNVVVNTHTGTGLNGTTVVAACTAAAPSAHVQDTWLLGISGAVGAHCFIKLHATKGLHSSAMTRWHYIPLPFLSDGQLKYFSYTKAKF